MDDKPEPCPNCDGMCGHEDDRCVNNGPCPLITCARCLRWWRPPVSSSQEGGDT